MIQSLKTKAEEIEKFLLFLVIFFLPTQLGKHFWPGFSYIYSLKIDYLSPAVYLWDILAVTLVLVWVLNKPKLNNIAFSVGSVFLITQAISLLTASNIGAGLVRLEQLAIILAFGIYIASNPLSKLRNIAKPLMLSVFLVSVLGICQFVSGKSLGLWILGERSFGLYTPSIATFSWYGQVFLRPYSTFPHPNLFGAFAVLAIFVLLYLNPSLLKKYTNKFVLIIALLAGLLTFSRAVAVVILAQALFLLRPRLWLLLICAALLAPFLYIRFASAFNFDALSLIRREQLMLVAWEFFASKPLFGIGLNNFINLIAVSELVSGSSRFLQPVHNIYLLVLAETGIVGFLGFFILMGAAIRKLCLNNLFKSPIFFAWIAIFFLGLFDHYFLTLPQGQRLFFLVWGLSLAKGWPAR